MDAYQEAFGQQVRRLRHRLGATQEEVAHRAGLHVTYLSGIERGIRNPSLKNIRALAQALGVGAAELFAFEDAGA
ncbi:MAG: helix-turn-helix transcriptional regulator [Chloroflexota bacterium]|nr:helix-turn-helix transcriptional regulator [Chloroflexota bacterium]